MEDYFKWPLGALQAVTRADFKHVPGLLPLVATCNYCTSATFRNPVQRKLPQGFHHIVGTHRRGLPVNRMQVLQSVQMSFEITPVESLEMHLRGITWFQWPASVSQHKQYNINKLPKHPTSKACMRKLWAETERGWVQRFSKCLSILLQIILGSWQVGRILILSDPTAFITQNDDPAFWIQTIITI